MNPNVTPDVEPAAGTGGGGSNAGWERITDPEDRRRTVYWRMRLTDESWLAVTEIKGGCRRYGWVWRTGPKDWQVRADGHAFTLTTARFRAEVAVYRANQLRAERRAGAR